MNEPRPLRTSLEPDEVAAAEALDLACRSQTSPLDRRAAIYWRVHGQLNRRRSGLRLPAVTFAAGLVVAAVVLLLARAPSTTAPERGASVAAVHDSDLVRPSAPAWNRADVDGIGTIEYGASAVLDIRELDSRGVLKVQGGVLRAQIGRQPPDRPVTVVTPHLRVVVLGTRFDVTVSARSTEVKLIQGKVRVESGAGAVLLEAGESVDSDDARLAVPPRVEPERSAPTPARPPPAPRPASAVRVHPASPAHGLDCDSAPSAAQSRACLERAAQGGGLAAQTALYSLGLMALELDDGGDAALAVFDRFEQRFAGGMLAPEVALRRLEILRRQGRLEAAIEAAAAFERLGADDPRAPEVALVRAELLCSIASRRGEGRDLIKRLDLERPQLRALAYRLLERCAEPSIEADPLELFKRGVPAEHAPPN